MEKWLTDLYTVPLAGGVLIYRPRRHLAFVGNQALVRYLARRGEDSSAPRDHAIEEFLDRVGFDQPPLEAASPALCDGDPRPTGAVLLMTNRCNLRCVYCYADAGTAAEPAEMEWSTAQAVIDYVQANARAAGAQATLTFHGGGEPTCHQDILERAVRYAREQDRDTRISMSSNGVWSPRQRRFIQQHFSSVSLSMDGVPTVQDRQRPFVNGRGSSTALRTTITALDDAGVDYGVRMTVLPGTVQHLAEGVEAICSGSTASTIQIEPTFTAARGVYGDVDAEFADAFCAAFMDAWRIGRRAGRNVYYSGARPWVVTRLFCLAPLRAMVVTAGGDLVTCFEIFSGDHPQASAFRIGRVTESAVTYDRPALQAFLDRAAERRAGCCDCFCLWHCGGDCATRRRGPADTATGRCRITRALTAELLAAFIAEGDGVWQGLREQPVEWQADSPGQ